MTRPIKVEQLSRLSNYVADQVGLYFQENRWPDLERGIVSAAKEFGFRDVNACTDWLLSHPLSRNQIEILAGYLTVGETYFFRQKECLDVFAEKILPALIEARRESTRCLRIWSAGCATGEEPYSIAILLKGLIREEENWEISILATDINTRFLSKAARALYGEWSFRGARSSWIRNRYFKEGGESQFEILPDLKKWVRFDYLNLAEDVYPSVLTGTNGLDIIFCRNVLMYFNSALVKKVIQKLHRCLAEGGWLVVSPAEATRDLFTQFRPVNFPGITLYQKDSRWPGVGQERVFEARLEATPARTSLTEFFIVPQLLQADTGLEGPILPPEERTEKPVFVPDEPDEKERVRSLQARKEEAGRLCAEGSYNEAAEVLHALVSLDGKDGEVLSLLGRVYANQGRLTEAREWCERAIAVDKLNPRFHYLRATVLREQGLVNEGKIALRRTLYLDPEFALAHFALGHMALQEGRREEANRFFENARSLLSQYSREEVLPESEGISAGRLLDILDASGDQQLKLPK